MTEFFWGRLLLSSLDIALAKNVAVRHAELMPGSHGLL